MRIDDAFVSTAFRYFAATAEAGSIRAAARELNIASSAVNRQILMLEDALGMPLFERTGRAMLLTEAGNVLLKQTKTTLRDYEDALGIINELRGLQRGRVRIATAESVSVSLLPEILADFSEKYPSIEIFLTVTVADAVTEMVRSREADLGFTYNPSALDGLDIAYEESLEVGAIVSPDHPLIKREKVTLRDCIAYPYAYPARGLSLRLALDATMSDLASPRKPVLEANSLRVMAAMAREGRCIAFQTRVGIEQHLKAGTLVFLPLSDTKLPMDRLMLVRQSTRAPSPATQIFEKHVVDHLKTHPLN
ncbi:LysR family transcriptional regulator [Kiloniella laminariae]|uniref:LysR family transcriptional regulator n=1 Tax=Kiloniella laminariae TaxID=454162 RepID=A0ABT4LGN9_9PROT|nr:LysR family transcriptional regulator [Kiloniella laminariae]MCZ4280267.1 LysR family transcriptional regulator [Kiloniella laminariae]